MFHAVAFAAALSTTNVGSLTTPVVDSTVTISGNNLQVPDKYSQLFAALPFQTATSTVTTMQLQTPSLREVFFPTLAQTVQGGTTGANAFIPNFFDNPIPLQVNEGLNYQDDASGTTAGNHGCVVFLSDGKRAPVTGSRIYTVRATAAITQVANTWVNGPLTFGQTLPVGNYDVVGMRVEAATGVAARLVFVGASAITRPGCPVHSGPTINNAEDFRAGKIGVWGTFNSLTPPSIDMLGGTATTQVVYLDLVPR